MIKEYKNGKERYHEINNIEKLKKKSKNKNMYIKEINKIF